MSEVVRGAHVAVSPLWGGIALHFELDQRELTWVDVERGFREERRYRIALEDSDLEVLKAELSLVRLTAIQPSVAAPVPDATPVVLTVDYRSGRRVTLARFSSQPHPDLDALDTTLANRFVTRKGPEVFRGPHVVGWSPYGV
ncbi:MAG: hypothetical protein JNK82_31465 [Myxococcaceae bacterium]|nr:hypothetical protein [Myxococcaceae bacterium]